MSANQTGYTELFADGTAASPSVQVGRCDTGFFITRDSSGIPTALTATVAGVAVAVADAVYAGRIAPLAAAPVDAVAASGTLTSNNTQVTSTDPVTIGSKTYTFMTALTPLEGEVLIGADADGSLLNLIRAINHTGTADTDYSCAAVHPTVSAAASVTTHAFAITAKTKGVAGNLITTTEVAATLSFGGLVLAGGIDGTPGADGQLGKYLTQPYICTAAATIATSGAWKKLSTAGL